MLSALACIKRREERRENGNGHGKDSRDGLFSITLLLLLKKEGRLLMTRGKKEEREEFRRDTVEGKRKREQRCERDAEVTVF